MNLNDAKKLANELMLKHGLVYWAFGFNNAKRTFGICNFTRKRIELSKPLTELNDVEKVKDTILHEIAHALTPGHGHDSVWKRKALEIGSNGDRCFSSKVVKTPESKYIADCVGCNRTFKKHRTPKKSQSCGICSGGSYDPRYKLNWILNPKY